MRTIATLLLALLGPTTALAQEMPIEERRFVAPDSSWSIGDADCRIDAGWDGDVAVAVGPHLDHHDLTVYDPAFKKLADGKIVPVAFGAGKLDSRRETQAVGYRQDKYRFYVSEVDDALLDTIAQTNSFQFYRGDTLEIDLEMNGFAEALRAMHECEAKLPVVETSPEAVEAAADAAEAAADAKM